VTSVHIALVTYTVCRLFAYILRRRWKRSISGLPLSNLRYSLSYLRVTEVMNNSLLF